MLPPSAASRRVLEMNWEEGVCHPAVSRSPSSHHELRHQHPHLFVYSLALASVSTVCIACLVDDYHGGCLDAGLLAGALIDSDS